MKITVKSARAGRLGRRVVDALPCVPGLAVNADHGEPGVWVITHVRSGLEWHRVTAPGDRAADVAGAAS